VHRFKAEQGHDAAQSKLSFPQPVAESRVPDPMMVGVGAFLAVVILVLWTVYSNVHGGSTTKTADKIPPAPVVTSVADSLPTTTATTTTATSTTAPLAGATTTPMPAAPVTTTGTDQTAATAATTPAPTTVPAPDATALTQPTAAVATTPEAQTAAIAAVVATTPAAPAVIVPATPAAKAPAKKTAVSDDADTDDEMADDSDDTASVKKAAKGKDKDDGVIKIKKGKSRVTLSATAPSWIQVTDAKHNVLYRKVLRPGEDYSVPDQPGLILDTANAGALDISVDGKSVPALGKNGDILRGVALDPQNLKSARIRD